MWFNQALQANTYVRRIVLSELPTLASKNTKTLLGFSDLSAFPNLAMSPLTPLEARLTGTAFDELQKLLVTDAPPSTRRLEYFRKDWPIFLQLYEWACNDATKEEAAITFGFLSALGHNTPMMRSEIYDDFKRERNIEEFQKILSIPIQNALKELREISADTIADYRAMTPLHREVSFEIPGTGAAEPDAVYGSTLVELKTSISLTPAAVKSALLQAAGYALIDHTNEYGIDSVEVWFSKQNYRLRVDLADLVEDLAASRFRVMGKLRITKGAKSIEDAQALIEAHNQRVMQKRRKLYEKSVDEIKEVNESQLKDEKTIVSLPLATSTTHSKIKPQTKNVEKRRQKRKNKKRRKR